MNREIFDNDLSRPIGKLKGAILSLENFYEEARYIDSLIHEGKKIAIVCFDSNRVRILNSYIEGKKWNEFGIKYSDLREYELFRSLMRLAILWQRENSEEERDASVSFKYHEHLFILAKWFKEIRRDEKYQYASSLTKTLEMFGDKRLWGFIKELANAKPEDLSKILASQFPSDSLLIPHFKKGETAKDLEEYYLACEEFCSSNYYVEQCNEEALQAVITGNVRNSFINLADIIIVSGLESASESVKDDLSLLLLQDNIVISLIKESLDGKLIVPGSLIQRLIEIYEISQQWISTSCHEAGTMLKDKGLTRCAKALARREPLAAMNYNHIPHSISATKIEILLSNPYQFFVENILKLKPFINLVNHIDTNLPATIGKIAHSIAEEATKLETVTIERITEIMKQKLSHIEANDSLKKIIESTLMHMNKKILQHEIEVRANPRFLSSAVEYKASLPMTFDKLNVNLTATIDRIDYFSDGFVITDYKTNSQNIPVSKIKEGIKCQLPLYNLLLASNQPCLDLRYLYLRKGKFGKSEKDIFSFREEFGDQMEEQIADITEKCKKKIVDIFTGITPINTISHDDKPYVRYFGRRGI